MKHLPTGAAWLLAVAMLGAGCGGGSGGGAAPNDNGPVTSVPRAVGTTQLTQTADHAVYRVGQEILVTFQVKSLGGYGSETFALANGAPAFSTTTSADGITVALITAGGAIPAAGPPPGTTTIPLAVPSFMTAAQTWGAGSNLAPGRYVLTSWLDGTSQGSAAFSVASPTTTCANPITITVIK